MHDAILIPFPNGEDLQAAITYLLLIDDRVPPPTVFAAESLKRVIEHLRIPSVWPGKYLREGWNCLAPAEIEAVQNLIDEGLRGGVVADLPAIARVRQFLAQIADYDRAIFVMGLLTACDDHNRIEAVTATPIASFSLKPNNKNSGPKPAR